MNANEILQVLDSCAEDFDFPVLDNFNLDLAQCKLSVFREMNKWFIVFELVGVNPNQDISNDIYVYSNAIEQQGIIMSLDDIVSLANAKYCFDDEDNFLVNPFDLNLIVNGGSLIFRPGPEDYVQLGIETESFNPTKLIRFLSSKHKEKFWINTSELFDEIKVSGSPSLFYQTDEWEHTDEEKPSENQFFKSLAKAIEQNDQSIIHAGSPNTHWSNWTWSDFEKQDEE